MSVERLRPELPRKGVGRDAPGTVVFLILKIGEVWFQGSSELPLLVKFLFSFEKLSVQVACGRRVRPRPSQFPGQDRNVAYQPPSQVRRSRLAFADTHTGPVAVGRALWGNRGSSGMVRRGSGRHPFSFPQEGPYTRSARGLRCARYEAHS